MAVWRRCRDRGIRHLHAQFTNQVTDIALLVTRYESGSSPPWTWSFTVHGPDEFYEVSRFNLRAKVESADFVVCISDFARSQLMAQVPEEHWGKLCVIHCGIDPEVFSPPAERNGAGRLDVLSVGRLVPFKGQGLLIESLAALAARGIDARATVVGWGETQPGLESLAAQLGVSERVTFTGALGQDEIRALLGAADVFCLPSFAEGVPVSLMEAMAMELPVVSSRIMGIPELVEDGVSGRLIAPGNVEELTAALAGLAGDPAERSRLGQAGAEAGDRALRDRRIDGAAPRAVQRADPGLAALPSRAALRLAGDHPLGPPEVGAGEQLRRQHPADVGQAVAPVPAPLEHEQPVGAAHVPQRPVEHPARRLDVGGVRGGGDREGLDRLGDRLGVDRVGLVREVLRGAVGEDQLTAIELEPAADRLGQALVEAGVGADPQRVEHVAVW